MPVWTPYAALPALALAVYANSFGNGFITDDQFQILNNPIVTGAQSLASAFGAGVWAFLGYRGNYYRPLQFVLYGLLYRGFGPNALPFHLLMAALHAVNTALAYSLARRLLTGTLPAAAWVAAAFFAVHPIHTEAVNWIAALPDVLVTTFVLIGLRAFAAQEAAPNAWQTAAHFAIYFGALLTKETGAMLRTALRRVPMVARRTRQLGNVCRNVGNARRISGDAGTRAGGTGACAADVLHHLGTVELALSAVILMARYFLALVWPANLNFFHVFHPA